MVVTTTDRGEEIQENFAQIAKYVVSKMFLKTCTKFFNFLFISFLESWMRGMTNMKPFSSKVVISQ